MHARIVRTNVHSMTLITFVGLAKLSDPANYNVYVNTTAIDITCNLTDSSEIIIGFLSLADVMKGIEQEIV